MGAELVLPNGDVRTLGEPTPDVEAQTFGYTEEQQQKLRLLAESGGWPVIKIVFDGDRDEIDVIAVGVDNVPAVLAKLAATFAYEGE